MFIGHSSSRERVGRLGPPKNCYHQTLGILFLKKHVYISIDYTQDDVIPIRTVPFSQPFPSSFRHTWTTSKQGINTGLCCKTKMLKDAHTTTTTTYFISAHAGGGVSLDTNQRALRREMTELFLKKDTRAVKYNKPVE